MTQPTPEQEPPGTFRCPICSTSVKLGAHLCPTCGADLDELLWHAGPESRPTPIPRPKDQPAPAAPEPAAPAEAKREAEAPAPEATAPPQRTPTSGPPTPPHGTSAPFSQPAGIEEPPITEEDTKPRAPVEDVALAEQPPMEPEPYEYGYGPPGEPPDDDDAYYDDEGGMPPLSWRPIVAGIVVAAIILIILAILAGAGVSTPAAPAAPTATPTNTLAPLPSETATPTETPTETATSEPTATPTETQTPTPENCCVAIQEGDGLIQIIGRCGHDQWDIVAPTVVALNDLTSADILPPPGGEICVPWPTPVGGAPPEEPPAESGETGETDETGETGETGAIPAPTEVAAAPTVAQPTPEPSVEVADTAPPPPSETPVSLPTSTRVALALSALGDAPAAPAETTPSATPTIFAQEYVVQSGDTPISIALSANSDVAMLATLNPQIDWSSCNFSNPGGGPGCNPALFVDQKLLIPAATYTPTLSPTPSGSETPTATPTPHAPTLLSPADGARFSADQPVTLRWVPIGVLAPDESYLVHVEDQTTGRIYELSTRANQTTLPPSQTEVDDGEAHTFAWTVVVVREGEASDVVSGAHFEARTFTWGNQ